MHFIYQHLCTQQQTINSHKGRLYVCDVCECMCASVCGVCESVCVCVCVCGVCVCVCV